MIDTFRAICAELVDALENARRIIQGADGTLHINTAEFVLRRARALLAQPKAEVPPDEALESFTAWFCKNYPGPDTIIHKPKWHAPKVFQAAAYAIARWGCPTPQLDD